MDRQGRGTSSFFFPLTSRYRNTLFISDISLINARLCLVYLPFQAKHLSPCRVLDRAARAGHCTYWGCRHVFRPRQNMQHSDFSMAPIKEVSILF